MVNLKTFLTYLVLVSEPPILVAQHMFPLLTRQR